MPALKDIPLGYQPGTQWVYSISVDVQGYMVERLSGMSFGEFLQQRLFDPLGMVDTGFFVKPENAHRLSRQYAPNSDGTLRRTDNRGGIAGGYDFKSAPVFESGGGGLTSTAADYLQFAQMHLNRGMHNGQQLLSPEGIELMRTNQLPAAVEDISAASIRATSLVWILRLSKILRLIKALRRARTGGGASPALGSGLTRLRILSSSA